MALACGTIHYTQFNPRTHLLTLKPHQLTSHQSDTNYTPPMASAGYAQCKRNPTNIKLAAICDIPSAFTRRLTTKRKIHNAPIIWQPQALGNERFLTPTYLVRLELVAGSGDRGQNLEPNSLNSSCAQEHQKLLCRLPWPCLQGMHKLDPIPRSPSSIAHQKRYHTGLKDGMQDEFLQFQVLSSLELGLIAMNSGVNWLYLHDIDSVSIVLVPHLFQCDTHLRPITTKCKWASFSYLINGHLCLSGV